VYDVRHFFMNLGLAALGALAGCESDAPSPPGPPAAADLSGPRERFGGAVKDALAAGPYTYFLLHVGEGDDRWVVVSGREHRGAARLTVDTYGRRQGFVSGLLDRTLPELYFGSVAQPPPRGEE
jgi:hypothetical protein